MDHIIKPGDHGQKDSCNHEHEDQGDSFLEMVLKPKISNGEDDLKDKKDKDDDDEDEDENDEEDEKNKDKKSKKSDKSDERLDLPIGDDLDSAISRRKVDEAESESSKTYKTQNSNGRPSGKKGRRS